MVTLKESVTVKRSIAEAFAYVADWETIAEWDPGVFSSRAVEPGAPSVGRSYELMYTFGGRQTPMTYTIKELEAPTRIVLEGQGTMVDAIDTIEFAETGDGTIIDYTAELYFKGLLRLVVPFMGSRLDKIEKEAVAGLKQQLDGDA